MTISRTKFTLDTRSGELWARVFNGDIIQGSIYVTGDGPAQGVIAGVNSTEPGARWLKLVPRILTEDIELAA